MKIIAIDIGNSVTHVGLVSCGELRCLDRRDCPTSEALRRVPLLVEELAQGQRFPIAVSSVVTSLSSGTPFAADLVAAGTKVTWTGYRPDLPFQPAYEDPGTLGADRIARLMYCCAALPGKDVIVIGAGTAVTVDLLRANGHHAGGVIIPGPALQLEALARQTSALPKVILDKNSEFPGRSTETCISSGVRESLAGGVSRIVKLLKEGSGPDCVVLATGGAWNVLEDSVDFVVRNVPDLTIVGTGLLGRLAM